MILQQNKIHGFIYIYYFAATYNLNNQSRNKYYFYQTKVTYFSKLFYQWNLDSNPREITIKTRK